LEYVVGLVHATARFPSMLQVNVGFAEVELNVNVIDCCDVKPPLPSGLLPVAVGTAAGSAFLACVWFVAKGPPPPVVRRPCRRRAPG
jgi:hypothetical protein